MCVCVHCLKITALKFDYADRGFTMFTYFHIVSISTNVIGMLTHLSEDTALRKNWSSGRCNVSWPHNQQPLWWRKNTSGCRVDYIDEGIRISTVRFKTHLIKYKPLIQPLRKSYLKIYAWLFKCGNNTSWKQFVCCKCSAHAHTNWYSHWIILHVPIHKESSRKRYQRNAT